VALEPKEDDGKRLGPSKLRLVLQKGITYYLKRKCCGDINSRSTNEGLKYALPLIVLVAAVLVLEGIVATVTTQVAAVAQATTAVEILPLLQLLLLLVQARAVAVVLLRHQAGHLHQPSLLSFYLFSFWQWVGLPITSTRTALPGLPPMTAEMARQARSSAMIAYWI
jgi:hypothetical protein